MLQIQGLVEGLIPVRATISCRSNGGYRDIISLADAALSELQVNCVTLYAKGAHAGYRSALPFLSSYANESGPRAEPGALRRLIDYLHSRDLRVGAIVQVHRYESAAWGDDAVWGRDDCARPAQALAAADSAEFRRRLRLTLYEIATLFPDLDYLFLEAEQFTADVLRRPLRAWLDGKGLRFEAPSEYLTYDDETARTTSALGIPLDPAWSTEGLAFGVDYTRDLMDVADDTFEDADWRGIRGLVYSPDGPAARFTPVAVAGDRWWLVPRVTTAPDSQKGLARRRARRQHLLQAKRDEGRVCALLELAPSELRAGAAEARELATLAREQLDGLLLAVGGTEPPADVVQRIRDEGLMRSIR